jgi:hypothetical protein
MSWVEPLEPVEAFEAEDDDDPDWELVGSGWMV